MLTDYIQAVMHRATYNLDPIDDCVHGEIPGFDRVTAKAQTLEICRQDLLGSLEEWIFFRVSRGLPVPEIDGIQLPHREVL